MCTASSTYAGSQGEGMLYQVRIARLSLCDSNIFLNANRIEVDSFAGRLLLMLEVEHSDVKNIDAYRYM